jgi:hypothetical protein
MSVSKTNSAVAPISEMPDVGTRARVDISPETTLRAFIHAFDNLGQVGEMARIGSYLSTHALIQILRLDSWEGFV